MAERTPVITDPLHLKEVRGTAYLWLRACGEVATVFRRAQHHLRQVVGSDRASWPEGHLTFKTFGATGKAVDPSVEPNLVSLARAWAHVTPPLRLEIEALDVFDASRIPIIRVKRTPQLSKALVEVRDRAEAIGMTSVEDRIEPENWIHHLSLVYYGGTHWREVAVATRSFAVSEAACEVSEAELVAFDGGPERVLAEVSLLGGSETSN
jgi:2'-5' RNA ligase superfamily protein